MPNEFDQLGEQERLKAENDFLKMKLMLEHGAIMSASDGDIPDEIENEFLNNIIAFEKEFEKRKTVRIFDAIGCPIHFRPVAEISDNDIEEAWNQLRQCLNEHGIDLGACSPNITTRELYRFTVEELFDHEMDEINAPGWLTQFIYDEFHPDHVYDNSRLVQLAVLGEIFTNGDLVSEVQYNKEFRFNNELFTEFKLFNDRIALFKSLYYDIDLSESTVDSCVVDSDRCVVTGSYAATAKMDRHDDIYTGNFRVELSTPDMYYWFIDAINIEGFNP